MAKTKQLPHKQASFVKAFVDLWDIDAAAKKAGVMPDTAARWLGENSEVSALVNTHINRLKLGASFLDDEVLRGELYQMAMHSPSESTRLRAAALYFDSGGNRTDSRRAMDGIAKASDLLTSFAEYGKIKSEGVGNAGNRTEHTEHTEHPSGVANGASAGHAPDGGVGENAGVGGEVSESTE